MAMPTWLRRLISYLQILISIAASNPYLDRFCTSTGNLHQTSPGLLWPMGLFTLPVVVCSILSIFVTPDWLTFNQRFGEDTDMEKYL